MSLKTLNALVDLMVVWENDIRETRQGLAKLARLAARREEALKA